MNNLQSFDKDMKNVKDKIKSELKSIKSYIDKGCYTPDETRKAKAAFVTKYRELEQINQHEANQSNIETRNLIFKTIGE
jgi:hypothetical protein